MPNIWNWQNQFFALRYKIYPMFSYAITKDKDNEKSYLVSNCMEDIDQYCKDNDLEIIARPEYVEPAMLAHHFIWVSEGKKPAILEISRPYRY